MDFDFLQKVLLHFSRGKTLSDNEIFPASLSFTMVKSERLLVQILQGCNKLFEPKLAQSS